MVKKLLLVFIALLVLVLVGIGCSKKEAPSNLTPPDSSTTKKEPAKEGPPTKLAKSETPEKYLTKYYDFCKEKKLEEAYDMLPSASKAKRSKEEFVSMNQGMPLKSYKIGKQNPAGDALDVIVETEYDIKDQGFNKWEVIWSFKKDKDGSWVAEDYKVNISK